ncbi:MAG TPA: hypothetical protein VIT20_11870 [Propionibacteriaceae bacterium]
MIVGYLAHAFDLINVRDLDVIGQARAASTRLIVGVLSDEAVELLMGRAPVVPLIERMALVRHMRGVDEVVVQDASGQVTAEVGPGAVLFAVADDPLVFPGEQTRLIVPTRTSVSAILRHALRPNGEQAVA